MGRGGAQGEGLEPSGSLPLQAWLDFTQRLHGFRSAGPADIILLIPMRLSVMALDVGARLSLAVFLEVQRGEEECHQKAWLKKAPDSSKIPPSNLSNQHAF